MRFISAVLASTGALAGCSDSTGPQDFVLQPGTYELGLSACAGCPDGSTPVFAAVWRDGVVARIDISSADEDDAQGAILVLETNGGDSLLGVLASTSIGFSGSGNVYEGSVGFGDGTVTILLHPDGCGFELEYPGVDTGTGSCALQ